MPCRPSAPICGHRSRGKVLVWSISSARGAILSSEKLRVVSRSMSMSSPSPKSKPCQALGIMRAPWCCPGIIERKGKFRPRRRAPTERPRPAADRAPRAGPGWANRIALHFLAAGEPQQHALLLGLDALGQERQVERAAERHDRLHQRVAAGIAAERRDKAPIDLELVEVEALQIGQTGIAGAEIVERQADAERLQRIEPRLGLVGIVDQHALGHLEHQPGRRNAVSGERVGNELDQRRVAHLHRRQIDRHVDAGPTPGVGERAAQHEFAKPGHQPGLLGHRDELHGRDVAALRMGPAQ